MKRKNVFNGTVLHLQFIDEMGTVLIKKNPCEKSAVE